MVFVLCISTDGCWVMASPVCISINISGRVDIPHNIKEKGKWLSPEQCKLKDKGILSAITKSISALDCFKHLRLKSVVTFFNELKVLV